MHFNDAAFVKEQINRRFLDAYTLETTKMTKHSHILDKPLKNPKMSTFHHNFAVLFSR
jgi:hypothetical protein